LRDTILWIILAYALGSIPTGYLLVRFLTGQDIRVVGSGNIGATNVRRVMGKRWAVLVTIIDMLKGALGMLGAAASGIADPASLSWIALSGVLGHNFPVWLKFQGGKGIAISYGVLFFIAPPVSFAVTLMGGAVWYGVLKLSHYVSLASIVSLGTVPLFFWMLSVPWPYIAFSVVLALLAAMRHHQNIERLFLGTESRV
jgi:glycerol-3-phosphate acyltransferase PlsY